MSALETIADPAGMVRELVLLRGDTVSLGRLLVERDEEIAALWAEVDRLRAAR